MKAQGIWIGTLMVTGQFVMRGEVDFGDINEIFNYPNTEESKKVAASIRASVNALHGVSMEDNTSNQSEWATRFWERGFEVSECIFPFELEEENGEESGVEELDEDFFQDMATIGFAFEESLKVRV